MLLVLLHPLPLPLRRLLLRQLLRLLLLTPRPWSHGWRRVGARRRHRRRCCSCVGARRGRAFEPPVARTPRCCTRGDPHLPGRAPAARASRYFVAFGGFCRLFPLEVHLPDAAGSGLAPGVVSTPRSSAARSGNTAGRIRRAARHSAGAVWEQAACRPLGLHSIITGGWLEDAVNAAIGGRR